MDYKNVIEYQERLVKEYQYRALTGQLREQARALYRENLPEGFRMEGGKAPLFARSGIKFANGYNRIVIGDYGSMVEIKPEDMVHENICVKKGQEYRDNDVRYSGKVKFSWLTTKDDSNINIMFQKKSVGYADYVPGMYYVSPYECLSPKVEEIEKGVAVPRKDIEEWLKAHGVFSDGLAEYYANVGTAYGDSLAYAMAHEIPPYEFEYWFYLNDVCSEVGELSYEQFAAVAYNLEMIDGRLSEMNGKLGSLAPDVKVCIQMGLDGLAFPPELEALEPKALRSLLGLSASKLLKVSHFAKALAGCKAEEQIHDVDELINGAKDRMAEPHFVSNEKDYAMA